MALRPDPKVVDLEAHRVARRDDAVNGERPRRLPSALRLGGAADETAGADIHRTLRTLVEGLRLAQRQVQEVGVLLQTAVGALQETRFVLQRMRALAMLAADVSLPASGRHTIQAQLSRLAGEVDRIANGTEFNAQKLLDGTFAAGTTLQVGADASRAIAFTIPTMTPAALGLSGDEGLSVSANAEARRAVSTIETAIEIVSTQKAELGAVLGRLDVVSASLRVEYENVSALKSRITDLDMAAVITTLLKAQVLRQPATALQAQADGLQGTLLRFPV